MTYSKYTLPNGLRIICMPHDSKVSYCGFAVNAGSRDEKPDEHGLAHFVEHNLFKGTIKRKAWHILNRMENVGGELNAFTTKENTFIYSIFMENDFERAAELLSDLIVNSQFPDKEICKERNVVIDEIQSYEDSPSELIFDDFENLLFDGHPIGHNILGDVKSVSTLNADNCRHFLQRYYNAGNMVFFCMTGIDFKKIVRLAEKHMAAIPSATAQTIDNGKLVNIERESPYDIKPLNIKSKKKTHISHIIIGTRAYNMYNKKRYQLFLLNNILGGPGMNSRLNVSLREKRGLVYNVETNISSYTDTGVFTLYLGVDPLKREQAIELSIREMNKLRCNKLSTLQLTAAKKQAIGQMGVANDNSESRFLAIGKSFLYTDNYETLTEVFRKTEEVTSEAIIETANEIFNPDKMFRLIFE